MSLPPLSVLLFIYVECPLSALMPEIRDVYVEVARDSLVIVIRTFHKGGRKG